MQKNAYKRVFLIILRKSNRRFQMRISDNFFQLSKKFFTNRGFHNIINIYLKKTHDIFEL